MKISLSWKKIKIVLLFIFTQLCIAWYMLFISIIIFLPFDDAPPEVLPSPGSPSRLLNDFFETGPAFYLPMLSVLLTLILNTILAQKVLNRKISPLPLISGLTATYALFIGLSVGLIGLRVYIEIHSSNISRGYDIWSLAAFFISWLCTLIFPFIYYRMYNQSSHASPSNI
jgi:hypothetical protein